MPDITLIYTLYSKKHSSKHNFDINILMSFISKSSGSLKLPDRSLNAAVTVGQLVGLKCKPDNTFRIVEWAIKKPASQSQTSLWKNWGKEARVIDSHRGFDVDEDGSVTLFINSTQLDDAGIYTCTSFADNTTKQPERYSAQLTVFGKSSCNKIDP